MSHPSRRRVLTLIATTATALAAKPGLAAEPLDEADPIAVALGYKADASAVDVSRFPKRAGEEGAEQFCSNCALYKDVNGTYGTCSAVPGKLVAAAGWCNVWVLKS